MKISDLSKGPREGGIQILLFCVWMCRFTISVEEVKAALTKPGQGRAPGPDNITLCDVAKLPFDRDFDIKRKPFHFRQSVQV